MILGRGWPHSSSLISGDAEHYQWIAKHGYASFRQAFFPLLPLIWRILSLDVLGVSLLNSALYLSSLVYLAWLLRVDSKALLVWMTVPSAIFYFAPYTEALFFLGACLVISNFRYRSRSALIIGLLICTLSRPAFTTLLPSLLLVSLIYSSDLRSFFKDAVTYVLVSAIGVFIVSVIQHHYTGEWFGFYTAQQGWGNELRFPEFPLSTWGGQDVVRLDAVAFLFGMVAMIYLIRILWSRYREQVATIPPEVILSCSALASISILTLFFRGGEVFSLNRFVFSTPFALVLIDHLFKIRSPLGAKQYVLIFFSLICYFLLFGAYVHIQVMLKFAGLALYLLLFIYMIGKDGPGKTWLFRAWILAAFLIQLYFSLKFLNGEWVA